MCPPLFAQNLKTYDQKLSNTINFKMVAIPAGKFQIGSQSILAGTDETPVKEIKLSAFSMEEHEVTFEEWEYACKSANAQDIEPEDLKAYAYSKENSGGKFHHVKNKKPNGWGLYDMLGNLSEWTLDQYNPAAYASMAAKDPMTTPGAKNPWTVRGGSYLDVENALRCSNRIPSEVKWNQRDPQVPKRRWWLTDGMFVGFRVVRPFVQPSKEEIDKFYSLYLK